MTTTINGQERFGFGKNWRSFLDRLDDERIAEAEISLRGLLQMDTLAGKQFLDAGSGSGLFSLAARRLGAVVHSFDYDPESVACTEELRRRYFPEDDGWSVEPGDLLDKEYMAGLGSFDVVYSWGVAHHTGDMWLALEHLLGCVAPGGKLALALYNDQGRTTRIWTRVKKAYVFLPSVLRPLVFLPAAARLWGPTMLRDFVRLRPFHTWRTYKSNRGMSAWHDLIDWIGGWPFEAATPEAVFRFCKERGLRLEDLRTQGGGLGCNEFLFRRTANNES